MNVLHHDGMSGSCAPTPHQRPSLVENYKDDLGVSRPGQLSLIPLLNLNKEIEPTPRRTSRKHPGVTELPYLKAIQALLQGPTPLAQLIHLDDATDGAVLIEALRQGGLQLPVRRVPIFDANDEVILCDVCILTAADVRRIHRALKKVEADHA